MSWHYSNKLIQGFENSRCSRVLAAESSAGNSLAGEPFAQLKSTTTAGESSCNGKTTDALSPSPSGTMSEPSTAIHGEELLTWFQAAFHARTLAMRAVVLESTVPEVVSGFKWHESFAKYDPTSCSWKTHQLLLFEDFIESLETFPRWGMMQNGECWELTMPELPICEIDAGFWPTPTVCGNHNRKRQQDQRRRSFNSCEKGHVGNAMRDGYGQSATEPEPAYHKERNDPTHRQIWETITDSVESGRQAQRTTWWDSEHGLGRLADGMADLMERVRATGNGQVPGVVKLAWETLTPV